MIWYNGSTHNLVSLSCLSDGEKCMMTYEDRSRNHLWFTFFVRYNFHNAIFITSATQGFCPHIASISFSMSIISCILIKCRNFNVLEMIWLWTQYLCETIAKTFHGTYSTGIFIPIKLNIIIALLIRFNRILQKLFFSCFHRQALHVCTSIYTLKKIKTWSDSK